MVSDTLQGGTSLWSTQPQVHPGRTEAHRKPEQEGAQAEDLLTMAGAGAVTAEEGTTGETPGVLYEGIRGLQALYTQAVIDLVAEGFPEVLLQEALPASHPSAAPLLPEALHRLSTHHQELNAAKALQQSLT